MKKTILNIAYTIGIIFIVWIIISTVQGMFHIGTIQNWNFWQCLVNLMKWRLSW